MANRPKVFVTRAIPEAARQILAAACDFTIWDHEETPVPADVLEREIADADGVFSLLTERWDAARLAKAPRLKVIANMAVGFDNINLADCTARKVLATNTPGVLTETTADLAFGLLMATARRIPEGDRAVRAGEWKTWSPMYMTGQDVYGATLGIIGMGQIGSALARRAQGFDMKVLYHDIRRNDKAEQALGVQYREKDDLLRESDFVVLFTNLTPQTRNMIGERELALMKPTAVFINPARGGLVDEDALYRALKAGQIWAAGLDVFAKEPAAVDHPLLSLPNVVVLPHIASASIPTRTRMATLAAENLVAVLTGGRPLTPLNPEVLA